MRSATSTGSRSPLALAGFRWFFAARSVSLLGSSMAPVALAFAILEQTNSVGDLGIVLAANVVPLLGFMLLGGAIADRHSRKAVLLVANLGAGLTQAAVAILLLTGSYQLVTVAALEFLNGTLAAFTRPALRGIVPELVATVFSRRRTRYLLSAAMSPGSSGRRRQPCWSPVSVVGPPSPSTLPAICWPQRC